MIKQSCSNFGSRRPGSTRRALTSAALAAAVAIYSSSAATGASFVPLSVSGYDTDVIFENADPSTATGKFGSRNFAEEGSTNPVIAGFAGLNATGTYATTVGTDDLTFQLGPYTGNNIGLINYSTSATTTSTLTLNTPQAYDKIALNYANASLTVTGGLGRIAASFDAIVNYSDATTETFAIPQLDWGITTPSVLPNFDVFNVSRINSADGILGAGDSANGTDVAVRWGSFGFILDVDNSKTINSVTLSAGVAETTGGQGAFFGISAAAVPEPSSMAILAVGMALLGLRRTSRSRQVSS